MTGGYLYALCNPIYHIYGQNVYKLGKTRNLPQRKNSYITPYIDESIYEYTSEYFNDMDSAEQILFVLLKKYRIKKKREFFDCSLETIITNIKKIQLILIGKNKPQFEIGTTAEDNIIKTIPININITNIQPNITDIQPNIADIQPNIADIQPNITNIQPNITNIQPYITNITNVTNIQSSNQKQCPKCLKIFSTLQRLQSHLKRKVPCRIEITENHRPKKFICQYCYKGFTRNDSLIRHQKDACINLKPVNFEIPDEENELLKQTIKKLEHQMIQLKERQIISDQKQTIKKLEHQIIRLKEKHSISDQK